MGKVLTILIVEDEAITAVWLEYDLNRRGFSISGVVATGEDAIESAQQKNPDVVLMDIRLAGIIDGIEAAKEIRSFSDALIIFMTGYSDNETKKRALEVSNVKYFIKPFRMDVIVTAVESAAGKQT